jgi:hypothetical protein
MEKAIGLIVTWWQAREVALASRGSMGGTYEKAWNWAPSRSLPGGRRTACQFGRWEG